MWDAGHTDLAHSCKIHHCIHDGPCCNGSHLHLSQDSEAQAAGLAYHDPGLVLDCSQWRLRGSLMLAVIPTQLEGACHDPDPAVCMASHRRILVCCVANQTACVGQVDCIDCHSQAHRTAAESLATTTLLVQGTCRCREQESVAQLENAVTCLPAAAHGSGCGCQTCEPAGLASARSQPHSLA